MSWSVTVQAQKKGHLKKKLKEALSGVTEKDAVVEAAVGFVKNIKVADGMQMELSTSGHLDSTGGNGTFSVVQVPIPTGAAPEPDESE